jgi:hypothetical protein
MRPLQEWIHLIEEGAGSRWIRSLLFVVFLIGLATLYNHRCFRHFSNPEAMDAAQLARNISEGRGFTTDFIRPVDLHFLKQARGKTFLTEAQPDLANAPLYPWLLAAWMRVGGFDFRIGADLVEAGEDYDPERRIACFNQFLFVGVILGTWWLARRLFDPFVASVAAALLTGTDLLWRYSISGLSTCLAMLLVVLLAHLLVSVERSSEEEVGAGWKPLMAAAGLGLTVGALGLTRYAAAWLILPVVLCVTVWLGSRGFAAGLAVLAGFLLVMAPWCARNYGLTGLAFGTAGLAVHQETTRFPGNLVERLMNPEDGKTQRDIRQVGPGEYWAKLQAKLPDELRVSLPALGGNWITACFFTGLLIPFRRLGLTRLRWFTAASAVFLLLVQALGRTRWGVESPVVNSDDLLVLLAPLVFVFGGGTFSVLLGRGDSSPMMTRRIVAPLFVGVLCLPLVFRLYGGESGRFAYPPYYPPIIQERGSWMGEDELVMTDVPWAMAWYGDRASIWTPSEFGPGFLQIDREKRVSAVYLTARTLDGALVSEMLRGQDPALGRFAAEAIVNREVPPGFPLEHAFAEGFPFQLFLSDRPRWRQREVPDVELNSRKTGDK